MLGIVFHLTVTAQWGNSCIVRHLYVCYTVTGVMMSYLCYILYNVYSEVKISPLFPCWISLKIPHTPAVKTRWCVPSHIRPVYVLFSGYLRQGCDAEFVQKVESVTHFVKVFGYNHVENYSARMLIVFPVHPDEFLGKSIGNHCLFFCLSDFVMNY